MLLGTKNILTKADKLIFSFTQDDKVYIIGSRKVDQIDLSAEYDRYEIDSLYGGYGASGCIPMPPSYSLTGSMRGFIQTVGNTFEEAMFNLLLAFREEEQEEKRQAAMAAERAAAYEAERQAYDDEGYWDNYDYDYDDGYCSCWDCGQR